MPWKIATLGFIAVTFLLAGCSTTSDSSADTSRSASAATSAAGDGRCDASGAQAAVGRQASMDLLNQVRSQSGAQDARILGPNDMVTLEYRSDRVNVNTDATGKVIRVNCG
ncbi:I78 family peptidase inhibitor [uncultured Pseudomonas sp.]|uniref:I78 family peptidase inhibitor n=1 Tax=uncultured Pseudomonas sp. TaxID=114707 RepID=UPI0025FE8EBD|nr:I78 family peptidase inhibitor [uncultured Pseudomonas sp.]